jgi:hypothetical protein
MKRPGGFSGRDRDNACPSPYEKGNRHKSLEEFCPAAKNNLKVAGSTEGGMESERGITRGVSPAASMKKGFAR